MNRDIPRFLSIIVPVYNQASTIKKNLKAILAELDVLSIPYEMIVIIDGSPDNSLKEVKKITSRKVHVYGYKTNKGKGYAVRYGMARSKGDVIGFIDAGGEIRESGIPMLIEHMRWYDADIVVGSKRHPVSKVYYPLNRKILSIGYQILIRILFGLNITDSQVGLKLYKRKVLEDVLPRLLVKEFAFDIEVLAVAYHLGYSRIYESPIELDFKIVTSTISKGTLHYAVSGMLRDTLAIFYRLHIKRYYDHGNHRKWYFDPELNFRVNTGK
jgi:glycosyltransferase involved in cell wall biosynthesis